MSGLTNSQLEKLAKKKLGKVFLGVYPCDAKPKFKKTTKTLSLIFNLSKHDEKGTHYVAVILRNKDILYFDSYGKKLTNKYIKKFLSNLSNKILYQTKKIQHKDSIFCGLFCLAYLHALQNLNLPIRQFYNLFIYPPSLLNDKIVTKFLAK
jgi:hypothetical protein